MNRFVRLYILVIVGVLFLSACNKEESFPVYLKLENISVQVDRNSTESFNAGLKDMWIGRGGEPIGIYQLPSVIPFYPADEETFTLAGGIFDNGLSVLRRRYPFWKPVNIEISANPLDTVSIDLVLEYFEDSLITFAFEENFETGAIQMESNLQLTPAVATMSRSSNDVFQGSKVGFIEFDETRTEFEYISSNAFALPQRGNNDIYIEITYKNNVAFTAGLFYANFADGGDLNEGIFLYSPEEWKTVYLHVNDSVRELPTGTGFQLYIRALGSGEAGGFILLDNIRIVHFI